jgi:AraC-like DNA-binding protein
VGISQRQLARIVRRDFGMPPKQILRRARALDMASHLRGVADAAEAEALTLRYFDQAQMTREFTQFFGVSPRRFHGRAEPADDAGAGSRQARRLAALERLPPRSAAPLAVRLSLPARHGRARGRCPCPSRAAGRR